VHVPKIHAGPDPNLLEGFVVQRASVEEENIFGRQDRALLLQNGNQFVFAGTIFGKNLRIDFYSDRRPDEVAHQKIYPAVPAPQIGEYGALGVDNPRGGKVVYAGAQFGEVRGLAVPRVAEAADLAA